jgi:hypothetical protein
MNNKIKIDDYLNCLMTHLSESHPNIGVPIIVPMPPIDKIMLG